MAPEVDDELQVHDSPIARGVLLAVGLAAVALGVIGIVVPVMPTTPFLLIGAACFARASPAFYRRLVSSPRFGPLILEWRRHRSIPWRAKLWAMGLSAFSLSVSILLFVRPGWLKGVLALLGVMLLVYLYRIPSRDRPRR